jgi:hypothetical protein
MLCISKNQGCTFEERVHTNARHTPILHHPGVYETQKRRDVWFRTHGATIDEVCAYVQGVASSIAKRYAAAKFDKDVLEHRLVAYMFATSVNGRRSEPCDEHWDEPLDERDGSECDDVVPEQQPPACTARPVRNV